jgi:hypothetical protein
MEHRRGERGSTYGELDGQSESRRQILRAEEDTPASFWALIPQRPIPDVGELDTTRTMDTEAE